MVVVLNSQEIIDEAIKYISGAVEELRDEYWEAYYWQRGFCVKKGRRFDWPAGCRVRETDVGGHLEWFRIIPQGKGKRSFFQYMPIYKKDTRQQTEEFSALPTAQKRLIRAIDSKERELRELSGRIANINQRIRWLDTNLNRIKKGYT
jgi:hypothetical protein